MRLRIIIVLTNSLAIMLPITAKAISANSVGTPISPIDLISILFICMGTFLFVASFNFYLINLVDALLFVFGKLEKKDYNITYIRLLIFTILLDITIYITDIYKYDIIIVIIPILICAILCLVYYFNRYNNLKDNKTEVKSKNNFFTGIIYGFSAFVVLNNVLFFISGYFLTPNLKQFFAYELLVLSILLFLSILFIITKIIRKTKKAETNQIIKSSDFFLGGSIGGIVGVIAGIFIIFMVDLLSLWIGGAYSK